MKQTFKTRLISCLLVGVLAVSSAALLTSCNGGGGDTSSMTQSEKDRQSLRESISRAVNVLSGRMEELKIASVYLDDKELKLVVVAEEVNDALKEAVGEVISTDFVIFRTTEEEKPTVAE